MAIALVWAADIFEIVSYASRAFALYYALQSAVATVLAFRRAGAIGLVRVGFYGFLTLLALAVAAFGIPAE